MPVHIEQVTTSVQIVDPEALLTAATLEKIVATVLARIEADRRDEQYRASERDLSSVVERQRTRGG